MNDFEDQFNQYKKMAGPVHVFKEFRDDRGEHPENFQDFECQFAANQINRVKPDKILDVGSYRHFLIGLMAHYSVTTLDIRQRKSNITNEIAVTGDAVKMSFEDNSFDMVVSLCALEHIGLGRYGDPLDAKGDVKALGEMIRVLKPGGHLVLTTTIHNAEPAVAFNAHRIYDLKTLHSCIKDAECVDEQFFSHTADRRCEYDELTVLENWWDVYCGCWQKNL